MIYGFLIDPTVATEREYIEKTQGVWAFKILDANYKKFFFIWMYY